MTRPLDRAGWKRKIRSAHWTRPTRVFRTTALDLADLMMSADGTIEWHLPTAAKKLDMKPRTLEHHMTWLTRNGWLEHPVRGGNGRYGLYVGRQPDTAADAEKPTEQPCSGLREHPVVRNLLRTTPPSSPQLSGGTTPESSPQVGCGLHIESASASELGALDETRQRRTDQAPSRAPATQPTGSAHLTCIRGLLVALTQTGHSKARTTAPPPAAARCKWHGRPTTQATRLPSLHGGSGGRSPPGGDHSGSPVVPATTH